MRLRPRSIVFHHISRGVTEGATRHAVVKWLEAKYNARETRVAVMVQENKMYVTFVYDT